MEYRVLFSMLNICLFCNSANYQVYQNFYIQTSIFTLLREGCDESLLVQVARNAQNDTHQNYVDAEVPARSYLNEITIENWLK